MRILSFLKSSIGRKYIMASMGLVWVFFVFAHMAGNLLLFVGEEAYNAYSYALSQSYFTYVVEVLLVLSLLIHVVVALTLTYTNKKARPEAYHAPVKGKKARASLASRTMILQGTILLAFIVIHLIQFKFGPHYSVSYETGKPIRDFFRVVVELFRNPLYVLGYLFCLFLLGMHLKHGVFSLLQSFGFRSERWSSFFYGFAYVYAFVVMGGFMLQPLFIYFKYR